MSIQLPRNPKELHFTGSVRSLAPERPANAHAAHRPNALPQPRPSRPAPSRQPAPGSARQPPGHAAAPARSEVREPLLSIDDDDIHTQALDRDELNAALFPVARRENAAQPSPNLPVPHFRSAEAAKAHYATPAVRVKPEKAGAGALSLNVWLVAAILAGIVSYNLAPVAVDNVAHAMRALAPR